MDRSGTLNLNLAQYPHQLSKTFQNIILLDFILLNNHFYNIKNEYV